MNLTLFSFFICPNSVPETCLPISFSPHKASPKLTRNLPFPRRSPSHLSLFTLTGCLQSISGWYPSAPDSPSKVSHKLPHQLIASTFIISILNSMNDDIKKLLK